jgi:hypothetical protein
MRIRQRLERLEAQQATEDHGKPFLWFDGWQTYEEALAYAGLTKHDAPVFPIRLVGVEPAPRFGPLPT